MGRGEERARLRRGEEGVDSRVYHSGLNFDPLTSFTSQTYLSHCPTRLRMIMVAVTTLLDLLGLIRPLRLGRHLCPRCSRETDLCVSHDSRLIHPRRSRSIRWWMQVHERGAWGLPAYATDQADTTQVSVDPATPTPGADDETARRWDDLDSVAGEEFLMSFLRS
jgi:hypothetical protein